MATTIGSGNTAPSPSSPTSDFDPNQVDPSDAAKAANAKAQNKVETQRSDAHANDNIKDGRAEFAEHEGSLKKGIGKGISTLAQSDGVAETGFATLVKLLATPKPEPVLGEGGTKTGLAPTRSPPGLRLVSGPRRPAGPQQHRRGTRRARQHR